MQLLRATESHRLLRTLLPVLLVTVALITTGCGAGGGDSSDSEGIAVPAGGAIDLKITTTDVPPGSAGVTYEPAQLSADGATGPVTWTVAQGNLPPGMNLTEDGRVEGTPQESGYYQFTAEASDGSDADARTLAIAIDAFGMTAVSGLVHGDAWSGNRVTLVCSGFAETVEFEIASSESHGTLEHVAASEGRAIYVPGPLSGTTAVDRIVARDPDTGATAEVSLRVVPDPTEGHVARFGSTDVWFIDFDRKLGSHPYATDWHAALVEVGLRSPDAYQAKGSEADDLAELLTRIAVLQNLNVMYLRNPDGTAGASGLPISFPIRAPGAGYVMPAAGSWLNGRPHQFSVMALCDNNNAMIVGTAFIDSVGNPLQENNSPGGDMGMLGTFLNGITSLVKTGYRHHGRELIDNPVSVDDIDALKALLYGLPSAGGRREVLEYTTNALGRSVAYIAAHEIGHSLGLRHSRTTVGSIMNAGAAFSPYVEYAFLPDDLTDLRVGLPGPGRSGGTYQAFSGSDQTAAATAIPEGGMCVCHPGSER